MAEPLTLAPPSLFTLFPDCKTVEEKAFKFLETKYENGSDRRTGRVLGIDHKTVKSIHEYLLQTDVGIRFNTLLAEQTEDFYSKKTLTNVFELINKKIDELEAMKIAATKLETSSSANGDKIDLTGYKLKIIAEQRQWVMKLLDATLSCRPLTGEVNKQHVDEKQKELLEQYKDLLDSAPSAVLTDTTISSDKLNS